MNLSHPNGCNRTAERTDQKIPEDGEKNVSEHCPGHSKGWDRPVGIPRDFPRKFMGCFYGQVGPTRELLKTQKTWILLEEISIAIGGIACFFYERVGWFEKNPNLLVLQVFLSTSLW